MIRGHYVFFIIMKLKYKCEICGKEYDSCEAKNKHRRQKHPDYIPNCICNYCERDCKTPGGKGIHERICKLNPDRKPLVNNGNCNFLHKGKDRAPYGTWYCKWCQEHPIFETRKALTKHNKEMHPNNFTTKGMVPWNKGLTKETNESVAKAGKTLSENYANGKFIPSQKGKLHTEEEKRKISESRKKYLLEHPEKVPYVLNHHSKGDSYPEKYFKEVFNNAEINYNQNYYSNGYFLDFAWPNIKIYIEIDGEQHYVDHRIVEHDKIRTQRLHDLGWRLLTRIRWSEFQRLEQSEKENLVYRLLQTIKIQKLQ